MPEFAVLINRSGLFHGISDAHNFYPFPGTEWVLEVTAAPAIACRVEHIEADPILPRTGRFQAVHAKCPLPIPRFSFPEPMHILLVRLASFPFWEYQRIRAHPYSNRQSLSG